MKDHTISRRYLRGLCAELSEGDGVDPHAFAKLAMGGTKLHGRPRPGLDRKAVQLCHQVAETLEEVLADCGDTVLQALRVLDVEPAPDATRLLVTVGVEGLSKEKVDPDRVHDHLSRASGHLRSEVASAITRKRTPVLVYRLVASSVA
ncbi:MAG: ribosome-binding factor A [Isosphaeraceae bacterium]